jgi:peptidoglycan lytic transglycosylase G
MDDPRMTRGPSQSRLVVRRALALMLLAVVVAAVGWVGAMAIGATSEDAAPPPPTTTAPPPPKPLKIIFPEGFTRRDMGDRITAVNGIARKTRKIDPKLDEREYLRLTRRSRLPGEFAGDGRRRHLEGFLFPATYEFLGKTTTKQLVNKQLVAFNRNWAKLDLAYARSKNLTAYDVLTIASMVEKETLAPEERPLVAAVIYNRLRMRMPLGIDATIRYGLNVPGTESLRQSHLASDTPYNTRKFAGLPPTPIANPGLASMQAAAHPANVKYLFFVRKPDKVHHFFTADEDAFYRYLAENGYTP